jgi:transcriptional regulator with XRE-family HTH domain
MAEKIGISSGGYCRYESGDIYPEREKLYRICKVLNWNFDEVWDMIYKEKYGGAEADDKVEHLLELLERMPSKKRDRIVDACIQIAEVIV